MAVTHSKTGVRLAESFRDNLIIDRYDALFANMRASKSDAMRSENSEDALTWNAFRTLAQIDPCVWYPKLFERAFRRSCDPPQNALVRLWVRMPPPASLAAYHSEGESEVDVAIETPTSLWFIEAKYRSDISGRTTHAEHRDQILRNIDVGSSAAGERQFHFSLLALDSQHSARAFELLAKYRSDRELLRQRLPHRSDGLRNVDGIGLVLWSDVVDVLEACARSARADEQVFAERAVVWLRGKALE